jgi:hypothetical protein
MTTHTLIRPLAAALLAAGALAVAACGEEPAGGASDTRSDREAEARDAMLAHAKCMREHGVDMPDPQFDGGRVLQRGPAEGSASPEKVREAEEACKKHLEDIEPPELSPEQQQEMKEAALAHARCMREQGIENFPDPTFDEDGGAQIRIGPGTGLDPESPRFQKAQEACEDEMPRLEEEESP